ncbi:MAG: DUF6273 domain-containing protein [Lachnospiraceae bacterium]
MSQEKKTKNRKNLIVFLAFVIVAAGIFIIFLMINTKKTGNIVVPSPEEMPAEEGYLYLGMYPQQEIAKGDLSWQITRAEYDENGDASVGNLRIHRVAAEDVTYVEDTMQNETGEKFRYFVYSPLKWRILLEDETRMMLLSEDIIDCRYYQEEVSACVWKNSDLCIWLNGYFYENAFSEEEKSLVQETIFGNVFLLSQEELSSYLLMNTDFVPEDVLVYSTPYAQCMGSFTGETDGDCWWYLRYDEEAAFTIRTGSSEGTSISAIIENGKNHGTGIRPVIIIEKRP